MTGKAETVEISQEQYDALMKIQETQDENKKRATARASAISKLQKTHKAEFDNLFATELKNVGLSVR